VKAKVTPVVIEASRTISKSVSQFLSNVPAKHEIKELPKKKKNPAILGTAHILQKVLM